MKTWQRATLRTIVGFLVFLVVVPSAPAAVVLEFSPSAAAVGEHVRGLSDASGVPLPETANLMIFLAPSQRIADRARGPRDDGLTRFGILRVDDDGIGRFSGRVPDLAPGGYVAVAYCRSCSPGGSTFTVGEFTVSGASLPATGSSSGPLVRVALVILACGVIASLRWPRSRRGKTSP